MSSLAVFISFSGLHLNNAGRNVCCTSPVKKNAEQESDLSLYLFLWTSREREEKETALCYTESVLCVCFLPAYFKKGKQKKVASSNFGHAHSRRCRHAKNPKKKEEEEEKWKMENKTAQWKSCVCTRP